MARLTAKAASNWHAEPSFTLISQDCKTLQQHVLSAGKPQASPALVSHETQESLCIKSDHLKSFTDITFSWRPTYSVHLLRGQKHLQGEQLQKNSLEDCNWVGLESQENNWIWTEFFTSRTAQTLRIYIHPYDLVMRRSDGTSQIKVTIVCFSIFPIGRKPDMI